MSDTELEGLIRESGLTGITEDMTEKLSGFANLLLKWNRVYNLTGVRTRGEMLVRNIMDSVRYDRIDGKNVLTMSKNLL